MDVYEAIQIRKSKRNYESNESTQVPKEILEKVLEAGGIALSARNLQP
jgi:nitroreductase